MQYCNNLPAACWYLPPKLRTSNWLKPYQQHASTVWCGLATHSVLDAFNESRDCNQEVIIIQHRWRVDIVWLNSEAMDCIVLVNSVAHASIWRTHGQSTLTGSQAHARTHIGSHVCRPTHARTHTYAHTHTRTHERTHARTHAHTQLEGNYQNHTSWSRWRSDIMFCHFLLSCANLRDSAMASPSVLSSPLRHTAPRTAIHTLKYSHCRNVGPRFQNNMRICNNSLCFHQIDDYECYIQVSDSLGSLRLKAKTPITHCSRLLLCYSRITYGSIFAGLRKLAHGVAGLLHSRCSK